VFFAKSISKFVSPQLRKDLVVTCQEPILFDYLVLLEANDNPYSVQEIFSKEIVDQVFNSSQQTIMSDANMQDEKTMWGRKALHLGHYFSKIG
jgi:hypothetical protein